MLTCTLARDPHQLDEAFRLRYHCYRRSGAIGDTASGRFSDHFDGLDNQFTFLLRSHAEPVATVRISVVRPSIGWTVAPSSKVFGGLDAFRAIANESFVEASRLCFKEQARRDVLYRLVANMAALADAYSAPWLVACPREEHAHIYRRLFGFRTLAAPRQYLGVAFRTPLLAMSRDELHAAAAQVPAMARAWHAAAEAIAGTIPTKNRTPVGAPSPGGQPALLLPLTTACV